MDASWVETILVGTVVGLLYSFVPMIRDYFRMMRFVRFVNFDLIRYFQLFETGGVPALAQPLALKLSEKGILMAWKTQRDLKACQQADEYATLLASLEAYREAAGLLAGRVFPLAWNPDAEMDSPKTEASKVVFMAIRRDWYEFRKQSAFLQSFLNRHVDTKAGPA